MRTQDLLIDLAHRSTEACLAALEGLGPDAANTAPEPGANSITWLVWHTAREQDAQVAHLAGTPQVWLAEAWAERFALDLPPRSIGYGHTAAEAARVVVADIDLLRGYLEAAASATRSYLELLGDERLDDVIDTRWTPAVTRGVRLVSILDDACQHAGQAAYVRGLLDRRAGS